MTEVIAELAGLHVIAARTGRTLVRDVDLTIRRGEVVGLVGESGSGKTTAALALLGYLRDGTRHAGGEAKVLGADMFAADEGKRRGLLRSAVSYVPQSAAAALDPAMRIEAQLMRRASGESAAERRTSIRDALASVGLPDPGELARRFPHQLSGGQQQRVTIAAAFLSAPRLVVMDEPTTGLDATTQAQVLGLVQAMCERSSAAALFISHDLGVIGELSDSVSVLYRGRLVERGPTRKVLANPWHPYTRALIEAVPDLDARHELRVANGHQASGEATDSQRCVYVSRCAQARPECSDRPVTLHTSAERVTRCLFPMTTSAPATELVVREERAAGRRAEQQLLRVEGVSARYSGRQVLFDLSLGVAPGRVLGIVGESGSGKSTLSRVIAGLHKDRAGTVTFDGTELAPRARWRTDEQLRLIQYVFQDPYDALNPSHDVETLLTRPMRRFASTLPKHYEVSELLDLVALPQSVRRRRPDALSGGERQRVAIARSVALSPRLLLCDEVTSSLDVSVQAAILTLLRNLRHELGMSLLFVTHNMAVVRHIADDVVVLKNGKVVERGQVSEVFDNPQDGYTRELLHDIPDLWRVLDGWAADPGSRT